MIASGQETLTLEQARLELSSRPLRATSADRAWNGVALDQFDAYSVQEMLVPARDHHVVTLAIGSSDGVLQGRCGQTFESDCWAGEVTMIPAGYRGRWNGMLPAHLRIAISPGSLEECGDALKVAGSPLIELRNGFRVRDPALQHYGEVFRLELDRSSHPAQDLIMSSLAVAFSMHMVRSYTAATGVEARSIGSLHAPAVRRVIDYLHSATDLRPSLDELAAVAGVSRFHFSRLFTKATGLSPSRYLERARIEQAKTLIRSGDIPLAQIALEAGFSDQSHFTRRFRRWVGCTPAAYAREFGRTLPRR